MYFKKIEGEHIYLSPVRVEDTEKYTKWFNDFDVTDNLGSSSSVTDVVQEKEWLNNAYKSYDDIPFAIIKKDTNELIGNCGLHKISYLHQNCMIGIFIGEDENRNKGYGKEIIELLLNFGFNYLNMHNIYLHVYSFNQNAINCYKRVGFKEAGRKKEVYYLNNKFHDEYIMEILKDEWINRKTSL